jgi:hypothetical protein
MRVLAFNCGGILSAVSYRAATTGGDGRVVLGGARRSPGAPTWQCRDCDHRWPD